MFIHTLSDQTNLAKIKQVTKDTLANILCQWFLGVKSILSEANFRQQWNTLFRVVYGLSKRFLFKCLIILTHCVILIMWSPYLTWFLPRIFSWITILVNLQRISDRKQSQQDAEKDITSLLNGSFKQQRQRESRFMDIILISSRCHLS